MSKRRPQTATFNHPKQDSDEGDESIFGPAVLKDKLNTHHNARADAKSGKKKAATKKTNTTTTNKVRSKSKPVSKLESGSELPVRANSIVSATPDSAALYGRLRQVDAKINGLLARSTELAFEARDLTTEHTRVELSAHERDFAQYKADLASTVTTKAPRKSTATTNTKDAETIAQLRQDLDKAKQEIAARDATVNEQVVELRKLTAEVKKLKAKAAAVAAAKENEATTEPAKRARAQKKTIAAANSAAGKTEDAPKRRKRAVAPTTLLETPPPPTRFQAPATKAAASTTAAATAADKNPKAAPVQSFSTTPFLSRKTKALTTAETDNSVSPSAPSRPAATEANKKLSLMVSLFDDDTSVDLSQNSLPSLTLGPTTKSTKRATKRTLTSKPASPKKSQPAAARKKRRKLNPSAKLRLFQDDEDADDNDEEDNGNDDYENNNDTTRNNNKLNGPILAAPGKTNSGAGGRQISPLKARNRGLSFKV